MAGSVVTRISIERRSVSAMSRQVRFCQWMNGVCRPTLRKSLVKWPCQKRVMRSANGVGVASRWSIHQSWSWPTLRRPESPPGNGGGAAGLDSSSRSTVRE
jgi:hypothetical protein